MTIITSGIENAIRILSSRKNGITPAALQERTGLSRRFSAWDMNKLAERTGLKLETGENKAGETTYRLVPRAARKTAAAKGAGRKIVAPVAETKAAAPVIAARAVKARKATEPAAV